MVFFLKSDPTNYLYTTSHSRGLVQYQLAWKMSQLPDLKAEYPVLTILKWMEALLSIPKQKDLLNSS